MNNDKALIKTFNYGKQEHLLVTDVEAVDIQTGKVIATNTEINKTHNIRNNKRIVKYLIEANKSQKLKEHLKNYEWLFERFVQPVRIKLGYPKTIKKKYKDKLLFGSYITTVEYWVKAYKISKSLLSYVTQAKESLKEHFNEQQLDERKQYSTPDVEGVIKLKKNEPREMEMYNYDAKTHATVEIELHNDKNDDYKRLYYINGKPYTRRITKFGNVTFSRLKAYNINRYEQFKKELEQFFESVNPNNDYDFDKYLDEEVRKLAKYFGEGELEKLQDEYNGEIR